MRCTGKQWIIHQADNGNVEYFNEHCNTIHNAMEEKQYKEL
jgi:hypothetical protein